MSSPRLIAQDVTRHYLSQLNPHTPHSKNIHRYLRRPVLAVTKRILLPRNEDSTTSERANANRGPEETEDIEGATTRNGNDEPGLELEETRRRDTRKVEGLDWMDYMPPESPSNSVDSDYSSTDNDSDRNSPNKSSTSSCDPPEAETLSIRSIARMHAFLGGIMLSLPNDAIIPAVSNVPTTRPLLSNIQSKLHSLTLSATLRTAPSSPPRLNHAPLPDQLDPLAGYSPTKPPRQRKHAGRTYPQIHPASLTTALELYIRTLRRVHTHRTECVLPHEPKKNLLSRIRTLLTSIVSTAGTVGAVRPTLTRLLSCLTRELLAVDRLSEDLGRTIGRIVEEYEHLTSFASLAFLSSPGDSAEAHLLPLITRYVEYLRKEWESVVEGCKLEYVLDRAMDRKMRSTFKNATFLSIGHLLEVCREWQDGLEHIMVEPMGRGFEITGGDVPPVIEDGRNRGRLSTYGVLYTFDWAGATMNGEVKGGSKVVKQALRDLRREVITVNGHILPPVHSLKELVTLLRETLNSRPVKIREYGIGGRRKKKSRYRGRGADAKRRSDTAGSAVSALSNSSPPVSPENLSTKTDENHTDTEASQSDRTNDSRSKSGVVSEPTGLTDGSESDISEPTDFVSSGNEGDTDGSKPHRTFFPDGAEGKEGNGNGGVEGTQARTAKRRHFNVEAIDIMTRRLLIAASRTGTGGDAFFVIRDLFGGEDVEVVSSPQSIPYGQMPRRVTDCTIELIVRLASIVIKCHSRFDVYPKQLVGECEPLIQLNTTSTEVIQLQEVRAENTTTSTNMVMKEEKEDGGGGGCEGMNGDSGDDTKEAPTVLVLKEKKTNTTGQRIVSIQPAKYERVENWKTPS